MTDLTNADKYTAQFGFSPGVVVEVFTGDRFFSGHFAYFDDEYSWVVVDEFVSENRSRMKGQKLWYFTIEDIKSIRVLTGPFAIWQFAPEWAEGCYLDDTNLPVIFYGPESRIPWADAKKMYGTEGMMDRPWWCQKKETKNAKSEAI